MDEFPSEDFLLSYMKVAYCFGVTEKDTMVLWSFFGLTPTCYRRMRYPLLAEGLIVCDVQKRNSIIRPCVSMLEKLSIDLHYQVIILLFKHKVYFT